MERKRILMSMKNRLDGDIAEINNALRKYMTHRENPQQKIYEAMEYSLYAGGKRLRPVLMLETARMCGGDPAVVLPFACAMEMIHTYSLIHDDLPAMDNDDLRRGIPTNHKKFGEAMAILAGDALLNKAFEIVSGVENLPPSRVLSAVSMLAASSGTEGMIGGQVVDIESEGKSIDLSEIQYLHLLKTGAIIRSSCTIGALLAGASESEIRAVDEFASKLGVAFQIRDDILDCTGTEEELVKPIGSDEAEGKNTYVKLLGLKKSEQLVKTYSTQAEQALDCFGDKADFLKWLADTLINRRS